MSSCSSREFSGKNRQRCGKNSSKDQEKEYTLSQLIEMYIEGYSEKAYKKEREKNDFKEGISRYEFMYDDLDGASKTNYPEPDAFLRRCICNRKRHQTRIKDSAVDKAIKTLKAEPRLYDESKSSFEDFEDLYGLVRTIGNIKGIGDSTIYDSCIRLGWNCEPKIKPERYVYVHRKLIKSAAHILRRRIIFRNDAIPAIPREDFIRINPLFKDLRTLEIEDFLCVYHNQIMKL